MSVLFIVIVLLALAGIVWLGFRVQPRPFPPPRQQSADRGSVARLEGLPAPVARCVQSVFSGGPIPRVETALVMGRARLRFMGIRFPARFKFYHIAGEGYYHYIQLTWFGRPIMTVNERYLDGVSILDLPVGRVENDPKVNAAANLGLWAESIWLPSLLFSDPRLRWEAVDENTARMVVPGAAPEEVFTVRFDPESGLIASMVALRYQQPTSTERTPWHNRALKWGRHNGIRLPVLAELQWDTAVPWAVWDVETVLYNVEVKGRMTQFGGVYED